MALSGEHGHTFDQIVITPKEILQGISTLGLLEWSKVSGGRNPQGRLQVPYAAWRYHDRTEEKRDIIVAICSSSPKNVDWTFDTSRKNWLICPTRLIAEQQDSGMRFSEAAATIEASDQSFCMAAHADMANIVQDISDAGALP
ncbi:hypothetical protein [Streptomyces rimosus]|uniref:hypothetical protein n=1 Tax=Streptomyces rimosus TaxID=1927 RepID=UPI00131C69DC|nr:hypothetical protein [Streptomyces rimosus]